ncbi:MAG: hypothetical protein GC200_03385 [Tepidisphaera sp.]|nr:hypothetical protein [Tepidisphaera sp.]
MTKLFHRPKYSKPFLIWCWLAWQVLLGGALVAAIPAAFDIPHFSLLLVVPPYLFLGLLGAVPMLWHQRSVARRLRETDCHLCPDCGYDLRDHTDATPCPECGRVWNQAADTEVWRTLYKGHLKY